MYSSDIYYELDAPDSIKTFQDISIWCKRLSESHFTQFDKSRMKNSRRTHELIAEERDLILRLSELTKNHKINDLWIHCISGDNREGVYVDELGKKVKVVGMRLFENESRNMHFVYIPIMDDMPDPIEYFMNIINNNLGIYKWRRNGSDIFYSGMPVYEQSYEQ